MRFGDRFLLAPAGRKGRDMKMVMVVGEPNYHFTTSIGLPTESNNWQVPIYVEKTLETRPKMHMVMGRGTADFGALAESVRRAGPPTFRKIRATERPEGQFVAFTPELYDWFSAPEVNFTEETIARFQPVSYNQLARGDFALGMPVTSRSGLLIHTPVSDYSLTIPPLNALKRRVEKFTSFETTEEYIEPDEDEVRDY